MKRSEELIQKYALEAHPEGGYFKEVYTAPYIYEDSRETSGSIYFMLEENDISHMHVIDCDEIWYFHEGCGMKITMVDSKGNIISEKLGMNFDEDEKAMVVIPKGVLFGAENLDKSSYTFVSCVTTPQFQYQGFRLISIDEMKIDTSKISYLFMKKEDIEKTGL